MNIKTIEEKAKAYDEALEQAQKELAACGSINCDAARQIFRLFPQLRESEDEKIRKILIRIVKGACDKYGIKYKGDEITEEKLIACFEKQKDHFRDDTKMVEQKPAEKETTLNGFEKALDSFLFDFAHSSITDCEPKEYVKNHSAYLLKAAYKELNAQLKQDLFEAQQEGRREGYEAAKNELKPTEWSEEDDKMLQRIIRHTESEYQDWCNDKYGNSEIVSDGKRSCLERLDWLEKRLKSLRPQPHKEIYQAAKRDLAIKFMNYLDENRPEGKMSLSNGECEDIDKAFKENDWAKIIRYIEKYQPHWKPSEEQMSILRAVKEHVGRGSGYWGEGLGSLIKDLERLM